MSGCPKAPELAVAAEAPQSVTTASEVDKSIPEPVTGQPSAPEQPPAANAPVEAKSEATKTEKAKETEKSDDSPRGLLKEFQNKIAGVFPKRTEKPSETKESKKEESTEDNEEGEEKRSRDVKDPKERRSASRKRNSIFGGFGLGKKDEKIGTEETPVAEATKEIPSETPVAGPEQTTPNPETAVPEVPLERPVPTKRASIFDSFRYQFSKKDKVETPIVVTPKDEPSTTPLQVLPAVGLNEADKEASAPGIVTEAIKEMQAAAENKAEKLATKTEKRKPSLHFALGLGKKEKNTSSDEEVVEKPQSPFAKLRATVKSKTSPRLFHDKKEASSTVAPETTKTEEVAAQKIAAPPEPTAPSQVTEVSASA
ncbi:putative immunogenic protein [Golovinomyces cichoracearum]|uniref:Putative immunogenic protein n=1 Tax=Golovinomyces cichoracearum TaxID=62708 RepID=A0A420J4R7_9PEZI|nr:putative immunogenic protein [Golovinomyces cichoracearum]